MQDKKTKAEWVGPEPHDKPAFNLHLANPTARIQAGVKKSSADSPHIPDRLVLFLYHEKKVNQRSRGIDIIIFKNLLS